MNSPQCVRIRTDQQDLRGPCAQSIPVVRLSFGSSMDCARFSTFRERFLASSQTGIRRSGRGGASFTPPRLARRLLDVKVWMIVARAVMRRGSAFLSLNS